MRRIYIRLPPTIEPIENVKVTVAVFVYVCVYIKLIAYFNFPVMGNICLFDQPNPKIEQILIV